MNLNFNKILHLWNCFLRSALWLTGSSYVWIRQHSCIAILFTASIALTTVLNHWGIICFNVQSWWHINNLCANHSAGSAVGKLCTPLCSDDEINSFTCHTYHTGKESVISAEWNRTQLIFKLPRSISNHFVDSLYWTEQGNTNNVISQSEFINLIKDNIKLKLNLTVYNFQINEMINKFTCHENLNLADMKNLWMLMQDNEYLLLNLYENLDLFPKLIGSCGSFFATKKLYSVTSYSQIFSFDTSVDEWKRRIDISIKILQFLNTIEEKIADPLYLCDIKLAHFALTEELEKIKYIDLDTVYPKSIVNTMTADKRECLKHYECDFFDCRSYCNKITRKCDHGVVNNNLQIVCEKIFLGWTVSGRILVPGLLLGPHTPGSMSQLLQLCANPNNDSGTPRAPTSREIGKKLLNMLLHLKKEI